MNIQAQIEEALKGRAWESAVLNTADMKFYPEVRATCEKNTCGNYGKNWGCPPGNGTYDGLMSKIKSFSKAYIFTTMKQLEDSFDFEGMQEAGDAHKKLTVEMRERFGDANPVFGAGCCTICEKCAYPDPCRFPGKKVSAMEAAGLWVSEIATQAGIKYNNGEATVTYFSMILFD